MIKSLKESKAKLSELVDRASGGEDVLITVRGVVKARLTRAGAPRGEIDMRAWATELRELQDRYSTGRVSLPADEVLAEDRDERL